MQLSIRAACPEDVDAIRAVVTSAYTPYTPRIGRPPAPIDADYEALVARAVVWVAEATTALGAPLGVVVLIDRSDHLVVDDLAVAPDAQGAGVGSALLEFAEARARGGGHGEVRLHTNVAMVENLRFYPRRGYTETHRGVDDGFHRVYFRKVLPPS